MKVVDCVQENFCRKLAVGGSLLFSYQINDEKKEKNYWHERIYDS